MCSILLGIATISLNGWMMMYFFLVKSKAGLQTNKLWRLCNSVPLNFISLSLVNLIDLIQGNSLRISVLESKKVFFFMTNSSADTYSLTWSGKNIYSIGTSWDSSVKFLTNFNLELNLELQNRKCLVIKQTKTQTGNAMQSILFPFYKNTSYSLWWLLGISDNTNIKQLKINMRQYLDLSFDQPITLIMISNLEINKSHHCLLKSLAYVRTYVRSTANSKLINFYIIKINLEST